MYTVFMISLEVGRADTLLNFIILFAMTDSWFFDSTRSPTRYCSEKYACQFELGKVT